MNKITDERFEEIAKKIRELDSLIENTLDSEPSCLAKNKTYGKRIVDLFNDAAWIEPCIGCW